MAARTTQLVTEVVLSATDRRARVTQLVIEVTAYRAKGRTWVTWLLSVLGGLAVRPRKSATAEG